MLYLIYSVHPYFYYYYIHLLILFYLFFSLFCAFFFLLLLMSFIIFVEFLQTQLNLNPQMTIAFGHGSFNIANTIIQFPFIGALAWIVVKLVPGEEVTVEYKPKH